MRLSAEQVAGYARGAGLSDPNAIAIATAIAGFSGSPNSGESGGDPAAVGDLGLADATWGGSVGLWQIRSVNSERGKRTARDYDALFDPAFNARSMVSISSGGTDWSPWSIYKSGAYAANLAAANAAVPGAKANAGSTVLGGVGAVDTGSVGTLTSFLSGSNLGLWKRVLFGAIGLALVGGGLTLVFKDQLIAAGKVGARVGAAVSTGGASEAV